MSEITREKILETAVALLRRHGLSKVTVTDVARALNMSHGNIYRHFTSKADLLDAIAERWLHTVTEPLQVIVEAPEPAAARLEAWVIELIRLKQHKLTADPELFAVYLAIAEESRGVVERHVAELLAQLTRIVSEGNTSGEFTVRDPAQAARAILQATFAFHHPALLNSQQQAAGEQEARAVLALLLAGLRSGAL